MNGHFILLKYNFIVFSFIFLSQYATEMHLRTDSEDTSPNQKKVTLNNWVRSRVFGMLLEMQLRNLETLLYFHVVP